MIPGFFPQVGAEPQKPGPADGEWEPVWLQYQRIVQADIANGVPYSPAELLCSFFLYYLRLEAPARGDKRLYCLSFTMPNWERSPEKLRRATQSLAADLAADPGCGAWLAVDVSKKGREHIYGVALTEHGRQALITRWIELTGASEDGCRVRPVSGQKDAWGEERTGKTYEKLSKNLARVLHYSLKSLPPRYDMPLQERVIVTGCMQQLWERTCATLQPSPPSSPRAQSLPAVPGVRCCPHCSRRMPPTKRRHARWCSPSCRTMAYEVRRDLRVQLSADELDAFEERAAILEFEGGIPRPRAEQLAYEQQRRLTLSLSVQALQPARHPAGSM